MSHERQGSRPEVSVVVPLFDEEEGVLELYRRLTAVLASGDFSHEILFVNDGSGDATPRLIDRFQSEDPSLAVLHLSRNFGHQAAVSAGIDHARGRSVVVMDGDLQDPPELIPDMVALWREGHDVVYAVRRRRRGNPLKRCAYFLFYRALKGISDIDIPLDSGDFCLMDRKAVDALKGLPERARFVRGLRTFVGFRQVGLPYDRPERGRGRSKYTLRALTGLAVDGLVSFSSYPLRLVTYLGLATACSAAVLVAWGVADALTRRTAPRGWASTLVVVLFMGSIQMISLGIIGEYLRLIFLESKGRPTYLVAAYRRGGRRPRGRRAARADHAHDYPFDS